MKKIVTFGTCLLVVLLLAGCNKQQSQTPEEVSNWKTYRNNELGFEIKYPASWPILDIKPGECGEANVCTIVFGIDKPLSPTGEGEGIGAINLVFLNVFSPETLAVTDGKDGTMDCEKYEKIPLSSGLEAEKKQCVSAMDATIEYFYTIDKNGWKYQLTTGALNENMKTFDKMLESFKFINFQVLCDKLIAFKSEPWANNFIAKGGVFSDAEACKIGDIFLYNAGPSEFGCESVLKYDIKNNKLTETAIHAPDACASRFGKITDNNIEYFGWQGDGGDFFDFHGRYYFNEDRIENIK